MVVRDSGFFIGDKNMVVRDIELNRYKLLLPTKYRNMIDTIAAEMLANGLPVNAPVIVEGVQYRLYVEMVEKSNSDHF